MSSPVLECAAPPRLPLDRPGRYHTPMPRWMRNWLDRHQHPASRALHAVGIPLLPLAGVLVVVQLLHDRWDLWWRPVGLLVASYLLQWIGHRLEGNDVGEVILIKRLLGKPCVAISPRYAAGATARSLPPSTAAQRQNRRMVAVIALMVAVWLVIVLGRNPLRAYWWTHRLAASADPQARLAYFQRLVALGPTGAIDVRYLLNNADPALRGLGVALLNHAKPRHARARLAELARDANPDVAAMATAGLALLGDAAAVDDLTRLLDTPDAQRAVLAVTALARLRTPAAIDRLVATARSHTVLAARVQAIEELGLLGDRRAVDTLRAALADDTPFAGATLAEQSVAALLDRTAPGRSLEEPPPARPVSFFAARALRTLEGEPATTNGPPPSD
jgi:hypothetical protein